MTLHDVTPRNIVKVPTKCSSCNLREICLPFGLTGQDIDRVDALIYTRRRFKRGESVYRAGDEFSSLYAVRSGFFKTVQMLEDGRDQVTGFHMGGEIMGMDGIGPEKHGSSALALEDSEVCARRDASARHHASRGTPGRLPPQPVATLHRARLLGHRVQPAHDAR
jgi:hypothetical protein